MAPTLDISEIISRFPDFRVAFVILEGDGVAVARPSRVENYVVSAEAECRERWSGMELSAIPGVAAWRRAYKGFGIKSTSYRSSVERLVKRVLAGDALPRVNAFVDLYNAVSLKTVLCLGADDLGKTGVDFAFRFARPGDHFIDMAPLEGLPPEQPPKDGEVVYACGGHVLCRRWNWRQDARTIVGESTRRIVLTIQSNGEGDVMAAADELLSLARGGLGFGGRFAVADRHRLRVAL
ncbi:MAG: B3/4 domain-containing protein [Beijerinckiaceae bacterium]